MICRPSGHHQLSRVAPKKQGITVEVRVDAQVIWERFLAFNRARGNAAVPAGFLLGFMRRWRALPETKVKGAVHVEPKRAATLKEQELQRLISAAPSKNWQFHASDLCRLIGKAAYDARVIRVAEQFGCARFAAILAVHGYAVIASEISR